MVNKVDRNEYYDYSKLKLPDAADKTGSGEKFSLNYQGSQEEPDEKEQDKKAGTVSKISGNGSSSVLQGGVRLELSRTGAAKQDAVLQQSETQQGMGQDLFGTIRTWLRMLVQSCKDILYKIWNDPVSQEETAEAAERQEAQAPERLSEEYLAWNGLGQSQRSEEPAAQSLMREADRDKEIRQCLRSGDLEQVISLVTDNGNKTIAKNSTLLTYYDRNGQITSLSASDRERILHGDKNVRKL